MEHELIHDSHMDADVVHTQPWTTRRFHNKYATLFGP
jgi:hypothetical protein